MAAAQQTDRTARPVPIPASPQRQPYIPPHIYNSATKTLIVLVGQ